jgi:integrase
MEHWLDDMRERGLANSTVYARASFVSSFYTWLLSNEQLAQALPYGNLASQVRPKPPRAYKGGQALTDEELLALLDVVRHEATLTARRDYAMLLLYILTGHRREEVARLTWKDVKRQNGTTTVEFLTKGGDYQVEEVSSVCHEALADYLQAAGRLEDMEADTPLWTGHDRAGQASGPLSSHAFAKT